MELDKDISYLCYHDNHKVFVIYFIFLQSCVIVKDFACEEQNNLITFHLRAGDILFVINPSRACCTFIQTKHE